MDDAIATVVEMARRAGVDPIWLHVLVSDRCNHRCGHCYQVHGQRGEMALADVVRVIDAFRASGGMVVSFSGGEATLRADLIEMLVHARDVGLATVLYTNGYAIDRTLAARLAECGLWRVDVSLYSLVPKQHDRLTGVAGSWARTVNGIRELVGCGVRVRLKFTLTAAAEGSNIDQVVEFAEHLGCELQVASSVQAAEDGGLGPLGVRMAPGDVAAYTASNHECFLGSSRALEGRPCGIGSTALAVRSDGVVTPCTNVAVALGSGLGEEGFGPTVAGHPAALMLRSLTWADLHGCRDCDLIPLCGRCHASALAEAGDMLGPYEGACALAAARHAGASGNSVIRLGDDCEPSRSWHVGPYRVGPDGALTAVRHQISPADHARAERFPWLRAARSKITTSSSGLVQLRRKQAKERLDGADQPK